MKVCDSLRRIYALTIKEFRELLRDRSSLLMGVALPLLLIFIIGYGLSLDVKNVPTAVVLEDSSPTARRAVSFTQGSPYFSPVFVHSLHEAEELMLSHTVEAILRVPVNFTSALSRGDAQIQIITNGVEATTAMSAESYLEAGILTWAAQQAFTDAGGVTVVSRVWFNDANTSTWFYVPGLLMLVLTLSGVFLTAVVMAREYERGTFEALFVSPMRVYELILAKIIPYFIIALSGMLLCLTAGCTLYDLPMRGSLSLILGVSTLYLIVALGLGLVISTVTKSQFLACQVSLLVSFLPSVMLSGFLFDLHTMPPFIRFISQIFPTTYYLQLLKTLFLAGNYEPLLLRNTLILSGFALLFLSIAFHLTRKEVS